MCHCVAVVHPVSIVDDLHTHCHLVVFMDGGGMAGFVAGVDEQDGQVCLL